MTYTITDDNQKTTELFEANEETVFCDVLNYLGYYLKFDTSLDDSDVKEYTLVDSNDDKIFSFFESFFENACLYALTDLGYSVDEGDWVTADNVIVGSF